MQGTALQRNLSAMKRQTDVLNLRVASPCHVGWETMSGDDRVRFCDSCKLNVYDLAGLTTAEIKSLISKTEGGICGRLHCRADGTIITVTVQLVRCTPESKRLAASCNDSQCLPKLFFPNPSEFGYTLPRIKTGAYNRIKSRSVF